MKLTPRTLLPLFGFALASLTASAQHEEYLTQADVDIQIQFGTHVIRPADAQGYITTTPLTSRLVTKDIIAQVIKQLYDDEVITDPSVTGWKLVAVKAAPADLAYIHGGFNLYLLKENIDPTKTLRIPYPAGQFITTPTFYALFNFTERYQGANVINSRGTVTSYTMLDYTPTFTSEDKTSPVNIGGSRVSVQTLSTYALNSLTTAGYATIRYETKASEPIFYCAISGMTYTALGDFTGTDTTTVTTTTTPLTPPGAPSVIVTDPAVTDDPKVPNGGLVRITLSVGAAKLVRQSDYPAVPYFP